MPTVVTNVGKGIIAKRMIGGGSPSQVSPALIGWGTSATGALVTDTVLGAEATEARVTGTSTTVTTTLTNDTHQVVGTMTATVAHTSPTIAEAALFDAASSGNMYVHGNFTGISLNIGDSIQFTFKIQMS